ncbi:MAG TPA: hypothetical protein VF739_00320 [Ktedonobacterales bacterium]
MKGQERILRERFAQVACQSCGVDHLPDDMLVLAQRGSRWLVLLTCHQCKHRGIFVASFPHPSSRAERLDTLGAMDSLDPIDDFEFDDLLHRLFASPSTTHRQPSDSNFPTQSHNGAPITTADVASIRHFLDGFNGDFHALFGSADGPTSR